MELQYPLKNPNFGQPFGANYPGTNYPSFGLKGHDGQDFPEPTGTEVFATHDGWVVYADDTNGAYGIRVTLVFEDGGWWMALYGHLQKTLFHGLSPYNFQDRSHPVKAGDLIAYSDNTGNSTGPHLHFGLFQLDNNGTIINKNNGYGGAVNPVPYFRKTLNKPMKIYVDKRSAPSTVSVAFPVDTPDNLKWFTKEAGVQLPLKPDGSVDFDAIKYDGEIVDEK